MLQALTILLIAAGAYGIYDSMAILSTNNHRINMPTIFHHISGHTNMKRQFNNELLLSISLMSIGLLIIEIGYFGIINKIMAMGIAYLVIDFIGYLVSSKTK